jgi:hypothetical protein
VLWLGLLLLAGCQSYWEERELKREQRQLQARETELSQTLQQAKVGMTVPTPADKARLGPLEIELRQVQHRLGEVQQRLRDLD